MKTVYTIVATKTETFETQIIAENPDEAENIFFDAFDEDPNRIRTESSLEVTIREEK